VLLKLLSKRSSAAAGSGKSVVAARFAHDASKLQNSASNRHMHVHGDSSSGALTVSCRLASGDSAHVHTAVARASTGARTVGLHAVAQDIAAAPKSAETGVAAVYMMPARARVSPSASGQLMEPPSRASASAAAASAAASAASAGAGAGKPTPRASRVSRLADDAETHATGAVSQAERTTDAAAATPRCPHVTSSVRVASAARCVYNCTMFPLLSRCDLRKKSKG
jgi:hypothetical protein